MTKEIWRRFQQDTSGATAIEYGLIAALICVAMLVGLNALGNGSSGLWAHVGDNVDNSTTGQGG